MQEDQGRLCPAIHKPNLLLPAPHHLNACIHCLRGINIIIIIMANSRQQHDA
jgi:hypothetical protein